MTGGGRTKRLVLAIDDEGAVRGIGPVYTDESVNELRGEVEALGWENYGDVTLDSAAAFRAEVRRRNAARA